jgi:hypothetical protein
MRAVDSEADLLEAARRDDRGFLDPAMYAGFGRPPELP